MTRADASHRQFHPPRAATVILPTLAISALAVLCLLSPAAAAPSDAYAFDGTISREVLERYLDRSVTMAFFLVTGVPEPRRAPDPYRDDDVRLIRNIGAKLIGRAIYRWGGEGRLNDPSFWSDARGLVERVHAFDSDVIFQGCLFEMISREVDEVKIPAWVFREFDLPAEDRTFSHDAMLNADGKLVGHWGRGSVPDVTRLETRMWFLYLAGSYVDMGCEALHLGQVGLIGMADPDLSAWSDLVAMIRRHARTHARRHLVLLDAHVPTGGMIVDGVSLLDFNSFPLRIKEVPERPFGGVLEVGHLDALFGRSRGCITPSGWRCESLPYLVEFDNFGRSRRANVADTSSIFVWGWDEISWFAQQDESSRNGWLEYAHDWIRRTDPAGHLQMPVSRMISCPNETDGSYRANTRSDACPIGYSQEETIKTIWAAASPATTPSASASSSNRDATVDWPGFRGPSGQGLTLEEHLPLEWGGPERRNIVWTSPLVGEGHASPIVLGDRIVLSTVKWADDLDTDEERRATIPVHHVVCYDAKDGARLWNTTVEPGPWRRDDFRSGPGGGYAAPTPATDGVRIYVVFGSSVIAALDFDGRIVWRRPIEPFTFDVTIGSSPVVHDDLVLMLCAMANRSDSRLLALDAASGATRWETPLPETGFAHSTPLLVDVAGKPQLVVAASGIGVTDRGLQGFDPSTGSLVWWCRGAGDASSPAWGDGIVYADSGRGGPGVAVDPRGSGDVSATHVRWRIDNVPEAIGSPVIAGGHVYRLHRPNVLKRWRASDGEPAGTLRLDRVTSTWASPIVDPAGRLYLASAGVSYVVGTDGNLEVLAVNDLGDPNHASPAIHGRRLILVGTRNVYCVGTK